MKHLFIVVFISILSSGCTNDNDENPKDFDNFTTVDYDIYSLILKEQFGNFEYYVISEETSKYAPNPFEDDFYGNRESLKELDSSTIKSFIKANDSIYPLDKKFDVAPKSVQFVSKAQIDKIFDPGAPFDGWETFYKEHPDSNGYIIFGSIGYSELENEAIVEVAHIYGNLGAEGFMVVLEKKNEKWKIKQAVHLWVS